MKLLIIDNLSAGVGGNAILDFVRALATDGDEITYRCTDGTTQAESFLHDAKDFEVIVVAGGDGTVASVFYALRDTGIPVLAFPSGTANLLTHNLNSPTEPYALADMVRAKVTHPFDLGEFEVGGRTVGFSLIAGAGYDATIMETSERLKGTLGPAAYLAAALANPSPTLSHFILDLDGKHVETDGIAILVVNFGKIQFDLSITPGNNPCDGLLEVVIVKPQYTVQLLPAIVAALLDREGGFPSRTDALEIYTARNVHVVADPPLNTQYDGEPTGLQTPFSARALPGAANIIIGKDSPYLKKL